jgi:AraC-like DNA-binding protein
MFSYTAWREIPLQLCRLKMGSSSARLPTLDRELDVSITVGVITTPIGQIAVEPHRLAHALLLLPLEGALLCSSERGLWMVPPSTALWIPSEFLHSVAAAGPFRGVQFRVPTRLTSLMPQTCYALSVSSSLKAFLNTTTSYGSGLGNNRLPPALSSALLAKILKAPREDLHLPMPLDARLRTVVRAITGENTMRTSRLALAEQAGISDTTLARLMLRETGLSLSAWRQQLAIMRALRFMLEGESAKSIAVRLGYESLGGFTKMFRRKLGKSPAQYQRILTQNFNEAESKRIAVFTQ